MNIFVGPDGTLRFLWSDALKDSLGLNDPNEFAPLNVARASEVEYDSTADPAGWYADLQRVNGPRLGPFAARGDAILSEIEWIESSYLATL